MSNTSIDKVMTIEHLNYLRTFNTEIFQEKYPELFSDEFTEFCANEVLPRFKKLREKYVTISYDKLSFKHAPFQILAVLSLPLGVIFAIWLADHFHLGAGITTFILLATTIPLFFGFFFIAGNKMNKEYKTQWIEIKKAIFPIIVSKIPNCKYLPENTNKYSLFPYLENLKLIKEIGTLNTEHEEDRFQIEYNGNTIDIGEYFFSGLNAPAKNKNYNDEVKEGAGYALFLRAKLPQKTIGRTVIQKKLIDRDANKSNFDDVILEEKNFNRIFKVKSTSQVEARYYLTPKYMEFLVDISKRYENNGLNISFENGYLNVIFIKQGIHDKFEFAPQACTNEDNAIKEIFESKTKNGIYSPSEIKKIRKFAKEIDITQITSECRAIIIELQEIISIYNELIGNKTKK